MNTNREEKNNLEHIAQHSLYANYLNAKMINYTFKILKNYLKGKILELGPEEGIMTERLAKISTDLTIVEGAKKFAENISKKFPEAKVHNCLFEEFTTTEKFDTIILGHVLEHVENPVETLKHVKNYLTPDGIVFAAVPNAHSLHRQAAVLMGLLTKENSMSELDIFHGHRRVYSIQEFKQDFIKAGLKIQKCGGYWLKPLSNKQIEDQWTEEMIDAYFELGEKYPEIAAEIYIVASL